MNLMQENPLDKIMLNKYDKFVNEKLSEKSYIQKEIKSLKDKKKKLKIELIKKEKSLEFVKDVALKTQRQLEYHISDMVSAGLNSVFDQVYDFDVNFELRRGKTECDLYFRKGDELIDPLRFSGLGAAEVAAFSLRCACWTMAKKYRNVLLIDEPMSRLAVKHHANAGKMIKMLSEKLNLQIIMISHSEKITEYADKVFKVTQKNGRSFVKEI